MRRISRAELVLSFRAARRRLMRIDRREVPMPLTRRSIALALFALLAAAPAMAQTDADAKTYPSRAIKIIVPFPAGGPSDVLARMIGQKMTEAWGQPVVVENRVGANTVIGAQAAAKSPPDGYTIFMAIDSTLTMNQYLYRKLSYDPIKDFAPITLVAKSMVFLFTNASGDIKSAKDLIAKAKANPGKLNYGAGTITSQLMGYLLNKAAGIQTVLVRYNGSSQTTQGLLTKSVDFTIDGTSAAMPLVESGQLRAVAKFDSRPFPAMPQVPTIQADLPNYEEIAVWLAMVAPRGTPTAIIDKLHDQIVKALSDPALKAKADAAGLFPATSTPAELAAFIRSEAARWEGVVKETGIHYD
jgi:tripartite-type tricarboxylate transporter receptor subunit TctC